MGICESKILMSHFRGLSITPLNNNQDICFCPKCGTYVICLTEEFYEDENNLTFKIYATCIDCKFRRELKY